MSLRLQNCQAGPWGPEMSFSYTMMALVIIPFCMNGVDGDTTFKSPQWKHSALIGPIEDR